MEKNWNKGSFTGYNRPKQQDKEWATIDPITNTIYLTWTEFDSYGEKNKDCKSRILFSSSKDEGETWSNPIPLTKNEGDCLDSDSTVEGAFPAAGVDKEVYVCWMHEENIYLNISMDQGQTWLEEPKKIAKQYGGWNISIEGIHRANGFPVIMADNSNSPHKGALYVSWTDQKNGKSDTDIWIIKSTDKGKNWTDRKRVNDDSLYNNKQQFFSSMAIDQTTGNLYIIFYDRREHDDLKTDVYLAYSIDGGENFTNIKISEKPFIPNEKVFFGDYNNIDATNNIICPIWTRIDNKKTSIWTAIINYRDLSLYK